MNAEEIKRILRSHANWLRSNGGPRANLGGANLGGADLRGADLRGADLEGAVLPTGEKWERYLAEVVPAFLTAGGRTVEEIVGSGSWDCHTWENCPTHAAFGARSIDGVPILLRPRAEQFIQFFDAGLVPAPAPAPAAGSGEEAQS